MNVIKKSRISKRLNNSARNSAHETGESNFSVVQTRKIFFVEGKAEFFLHMIVRRFIYIISNNTALAISSR